MDQYYRFLLGRLFDRLQGQYPTHEQLPAAQIPDQMVPHMAQHRFRVAADHWPLVQVGPGLLSVNETDKYNWTDFHQRMTYAVESFFTAHPAPHSIRVSQLILRYIDAIPFDFTNENVLEFLGKKMKLSLTLPDTLFEKAGVNRSPSQLLWQMAFPCQSPPGQVVMKLGLGQHGDVPALILDTSVESNNADVPNLPIGFSQWALDAHEVCSRWFKDLTKGELYESFRPV